MSVRTYIGSREYTEWVDFRSISVTDKMGANGQRASLEVTIPSERVQSNRPPRPLSGQVLRIVEDNPGEPAEELFEGSIVTVSDSWLTSVVYRASVDAVDYTLRLDSKLVKPEMEFGSQYAGDRVKSVLRKAATEFANDLSRIERGDIGPFESTTYNYRYPSDIIDEMAEAEGFAWYVDSDKRVHFVSSGSSNCPIAGNYLDVDNETRLGEIQISEDWSNLFNVTYLTDFSKKSTQPYDHREVADGEQAFFKLPMPPWSAEDCSVWTSGNGGSTWSPREVLGDPMSGGAEPDEGDPGTAYICTFNWGCRFPEADLPAAGDIVRVEYDYELPDQVLKSKDLTSIEEMKRREGAGSDGEHEKSFSVPEYRGSEDGARQYAEMLLGRGAWPTITGSFSTFMKGWAAGQAIEIKSKVREIYDIQKWCQDGRPSSWAAKHPLTVWVKEVDKEIVAVGGPGNDGKTRVRLNIKFSNKPLWSMMSLDEFLHKLLEGTSGNNPPGPTTTSTSTSSSTSTTTVTSTVTTTYTYTYTTTITISSTSTTISSTSTTTTARPRAILLELSTPDFASLTSTTTT